MSATFDYDENTMPMLWKPHRPDRPAKSEGGKLFKLGFKHAHSFPEALELTIEWYRANEKWWRPLKKQGGYRGYYQKQYSQRLKAGAR